MARRRKQDWTPREDPMVQQDYSLWAVKVYDKNYDGRGQWVVVGIFATREKAVDLVGEISRNHRRKFPLIEPKLVHPRIGLVAAWVAAGNPIP